MTTKSITYYNRHEPSLQDGRYDVEVHQTVNVATTNIDTCRLSFDVEGPRYHLDPALIHSSYPPNGGRGDYMAVLPSLVLNRSTLPWERSPAAQYEGDASWLFLVMIDESETAHAAENSTATAPAPGLPAGVDYLSVDSTLAHLFPDTLDELKYLSFTRIKHKGDAQTLNEDDIHEEQAVILCNRLPRRGRSSTVYLVSLEQKYETSGKFAGIPNDTNLTLPYLYKWRFYAFDDQLYVITADVAAKAKQTAEQQIPRGDLPDLSSLYDQLYHDSAQFESVLTGLSVSAAGKKILQSLAKLPGSTFHELLAHLKNGCAPLRPAGTADLIAASGSLSLPFHRVHADHTARTRPAHYRSPLAAGLIDAVPLSFSCASLSQNDWLLKDSADNLDATYAAAFELGRLTALNDQDFATEFYRWKHEYAAAKRLAALKTDAAYPPLDHLPLNDDPVARPVPPHVAEKFRAWRELRGLPFRYLIPAPGLLPNECIRFFQLDRFWINAFTSGAFSIGHVVAADLQTELDGLFSGGQVFGFLINSLVVSGWPDFEVEIRDSAGETVPVIREDNLDVNIRLFLINGPFHSLRFHLHPGKTHFGFLFDDAGGTARFTKEGESITAQVHDQVVNVTDLVSQFGGPSLKVAEFAGKILEGVPAVEFVIEQPGGM